MSRPPAKPLLLPHAHARARASCPSLHWQKCFLSCHGDGVWGDGGHKAGADGHSAELPVHCLRSSSCTPMPRRRSIPAVEEVQPAWHELEWQSVMSGLCSPRHLRVSATICCSIVRLLCSSLESPTNCHFLPHRAILHCHCANHTSQTCLKKRLRHWRRQ